MATFSYKLYSRFASSYVMFNLKDSSNVKENKSPI